MASNNLRVVYNNLVDTTNIVTTLSASSAALPVTNLKSDTKSLVWRTATAAAAAAFTIGNNTGGFSLVATIDGKYSITVTSTTGTAILCASSIETLLLNQHALYLGKSVVFTGTATGTNIVVGTVYYIVSISGAGMNISTSPNASNFRVNLMATFSVPTIVGAIIMPFTNLTKTATITVRGYTGTSPLVFPTIGSGVTAPGIGLSGCTQVFSVVGSLCAPYSLSGDWSWGSSGKGVNSFSYSGGTYARVYIPLASQIACTSIVIEISDQYNTDKYIEVSRLIIGSYWTPIYNTQYGLTSTINDLTTNERTESGNLFTNRSAKFRTLNFDVGYLTASDRNNLFSIFRGSGTSRPLFVSLFPEDTDLEKERDFQIYGKLSGINPITHNTLDLYSSSLEIQEV